MKKRKSILILIISIITTLFIIGIFVYVLKVIKNKNHFTSAAIIVLKEGMEKKENILIFSERINEVKQIQDKISEYFINEDKIDIFVDYLERLGLEFGSEFIVKSIDVPEKEKNIVIFNVSISGDFNQVLKTIYLLENIPYQINITKSYLNKNITMKSAEKGEDSEIIEWEAIITFKVASLH